MRHDLLKVLNFVVVGAEDEDEKTVKVTQEEKDEAIKTIKEEKYSKYTVKDAMEKLDPKTLTKLLFELNDSQLGMFLEAGRHLLEDGPALKKLILQRIANEDPDDNIGESAWHIARNLDETKDDQELLEKVLIESNYSTWYGRGKGLPTDFQKKILEKSINDSVISAVFEEASKEMLMDFVIKRQNDFEVGRYGGLIGDALHTLTNLTATTDADLLHIFNKLKADTHKDKMVNKHLKDWDVVKKYVKETVTDDYKRGVSQAIDRLVENIEDPEFFEKLSKNKAVLENSPEILTKFDTEDLMKEIVENTENPGKTRSVAITRINDQKFLVDRLQEETDDRVLRAGVAQVDSDQDLIKIFNENDLAKIYVVKKIEDQAFLKGLVSSEEQPYLLGEVLDRIEDQAVFNKIVTDSDYNPDIQRKAVRRIHDEDILKALVEDDEVLFDIRRDIIDDNDWEDDYEELNIPEDDDAVLDIIRDLSSSQRLLALRSIEDDDLLASLLGELSIDDDLWALLVGHAEKIGELETYFDEIDAEDKDIVESFIGAVKDMDALRFIIDDDKLSVMDYYDSSDIATTIYNGSTENLSSLALSILTNGYGGDEDYEYLNAMDQDDLESIARGEYGYTSERAVGLITDQDFLKEAIGWGSDYAREAFWGINDLEFLMEWVEGGGALDDGIDDFVRHIYQLDTGSDKPGEKSDAILKLYQSESVDSKFHIEALSFIVDQKILADAINHKNPRIRLNALDNYTEDQDLLKRLAVNDADSTVRARAIENIDEKGEGNQELFLKIAYNDKDEYPAKAALKKITDQPELAKLALEAASGGLRLTAVEKLDPKEQKDILVKIAQEEEEEEYVGIEAVDRLEDQDSLFSIATHRGAINPVRIRALRKVKDQDKITKIAEMTTDKEIKGEAVILLDGERLQAKWVPLWLKTSEDYDNPTRVQKSAKLKVLDVLDKNLATIEKGDGNQKQEQRKYLENNIKKILKTLPYRHLPEKFRPEKRKLSFENPKLMDKDIKLHVPKANVQLFRLLLTMAR